MRSALASLLVTCLWHAPALAQCAPAPDSAYFFRDLSEQRAEAKIAANRAFFERLLSPTFQARRVDGRPLSKAEFIAAELAPDHAEKSRRFYAINDYELAEHQQGHTVVTYLLREGVAGNGDASIAEFHLRETYAVIDGQWRLTAVETLPAGG
jgi:hypothetical protein